MRENVSRHKSRRTPLGQTLGYLVTSDPQKTTSPWINLASDIVFMAAKDYESMVKSVDPSPVIKSRGEDAEKFLKSQYCMLLTSIDGNYILRKIKEEYQNG